MLPAHFALLFTLSLLASNRKVSEALERRLRDVSMASPTSAVEVEITERLDPEGFDSIFGALVRLSNRRLSPRSSAARRMSAAKDKVLVNKGSSRASSMLQGIQAWGVAKSW